MKIKALLFSLLLSLPLMGQNGDPVKWIVVTDTTNVPKTFQDQYHYDSGYWVGTGASLLRFLVSEGDQSITGDLVIAGVLQVDSLGIGVNPNAKLHVNGSFAGIVRAKVENLSAASGVVVGATWQVYGDTGYGSLGYTNSGSTILGGALVNTFHLYNQGYGNTIYVVDGNKSHVWYSDPTDSHDYSGLSNEIMRLTAAGMLGLDTIPEAKIHIKGDADTLQFKVQSHTTQTNDVAQLGDINSGDYLAVEDDGTWEQNGEATTWDDLRIVPGAFSFAGNADPSLQDWQPGGSGAEFKIYKFKKNDEVFATCQMPHTYLEGSDLQFHIHWTPADRGNEESGNAVGWKVDHSIANISTVFPSSSTVDLSDTATGTDDFHEITSSVTVSGTGLKISHIVALRIYRSDTGTDDTWSGSTNANSPALFEFDIHFQVNSAGSRQELVK